MQILAEVVTFGRTKGLLHVQSTQWQISGIKREGGSVLSEVLVTIGIHDGLLWVSPSQMLGSSVTVGVALEAAVDDEAEGLVDEDSSLGVGAGGRGVPEGTTQVDLPELVGI